MDLSKANLGQTYTIKSINTDDDELNNFLFTLGCYTGEEITVVSHIAGAYVLSIKDGRYTVDENLAQAICI